MKLIVSIYLCLFFASNVYAEQSSERLYRLLPATKSVADARGYQLMWGLDRDYALSPDELDGAQDFNAIGALVRKYSPSHAVAACDVAKVLAVVTVKKAINIVNNGSDLGCYMVR